MEHNSKKKKDQTSMLIGELRVSITSILDKIYHAVTELNCAKVFLNDDDICNLVHHVTSWIMDYETPKFKDLQN